MQLSTFILLTSVVVVSACVPKTKAPVPVPDTTLPTLAEVTPVAPKGTDTTPDYTFSSSEAGTIIYGGNCLSVTTAAVAGNNTITFNELAVGTYNNCTISVKDAANNTSAALAITPFDVAVLYTVSVNIPAGLAGKTANAAASFVVTQVDTETGKVTSQTPINNASQNGNGTWGVNVTTNPNAASVLIVHKNANAPTVCINCALPGDSVYAPLTDATINVNPVTTVTFDETIGTETPLTLPEMTNLMDGVAPLEASLPAVDNGQTVDNYIDEVADTFEHEIDREMYIAAGIAARPINDTGIINCGDYAFGGSGTHNYDLNCATYNVTKTVAGIDANGDPIPAGQDALYGRDANPLTNSDSDGVKGFSFTKLGADGAPLVIQNGAWSYSGLYDSGTESAGTSWSCLQDNVTGLIWEVKTNQAVPTLRDRDFQYTWYNSDNTKNGGNAGTADSSAGWGSDNCFNNARCDTEKYVADVNAATLCGANDWRMPTSEEILTIVRKDGTNSSQAFDPVFVHWIAGLHWTGDTKAQSPELAWSISATSYDLAQSKNFNGLVRLVRDVRK